MRQADYPRRLTAPDECRILRHMALPRPIRWGYLRADEAERIIRERAKDTAKVDISIHALDRINQRGTVIEITVEDVYRILRTGDVEAKPIRNDRGDWEVVVARRFGARKVGAATIVFRSDRLLVKTVMWMDRS